MYNIWMKTPMPFTIHCPMDTQCNNCELYLLISPILQSKHELLYLRVGDHKKTV